MISEYMFKNYLRLSFECVSCTCTDGVAVHLMCLTNQTDRIEAALIIKLIYVSLQTSYDTSTDVDILDEKG